VKVGGVGGPGPVSFEPRRGGAENAVKGLPGAEADTTVAGAGGVDRRESGAWRHDGTPAPAAGDSSNKIDVAKVQEIADGLNRTLKAANRRLQFLVHETTGRIYVKVIDAETEEVIREIPPEKILDLVGRILELVGLLVDEKV